MPARPRARSSTRSPRSDMRRLRKINLPRNAFWTLVGHFVQRLLAGEEESENGMSLGLGAVLAILASPGAFASIFLLDKYSTLLQWFRHQHFDSYKASVADEYFFVVLSMTVTGLVMVLRWNRLFPDRRDFANLAVLPIPIRNIFLANFVALFSLAVLFAVDVNAVSAFLFPFIVTISDGHGGSFSKLLLMIRSHASTVFLSSLFSFFAVFGIVGLLMLIAPKRLFPSISLCVRILLVVALLTEFFANMLLQLFSGHLSGASDYAHSLPSFWFLGIYETLAHLDRAGMDALAQRALFATAAAVCVSIGAYALCYRQRFVRLAESLDVVGGAQHKHRWHAPDWLLRGLFPSRFERACASFIATVQLRSERHLMFIGGYLGIGLVLTAQTAMDSFNRRATSMAPNSDLLSVPLMIAFFIATGLRFAFDMPATLNANWMFRATIENPSPNPRRPVRKIMLLSVLTWQIVALFPLTMLRWGWHIALFHTLAVALLSVTLVEALLARFHKIPFTCSSRPDIRMLLMRILGAVFAVMIIVPILASMEESMLLNPLRFVYGALLLAGAWYWILRYRRNAAPADQCITFEDVAPPQFELLKLV
jgi:hypothetical protein